jgi:hypothetical protein
MQKCGARRRGYSRGKQPSVTHELRRPHRRSRATSRGGCSPALTRRTGHVARCPPKRHCGDGPIGSADRPSWSRATTTFCRQRGRHFRLRALMRSARPQVRRCSVRPSPAVLAAPNGSPRLPHVAGSISLVRPRRGIWSEWAIQDSNLGPLPYQASSGHLDSRVRRSQQSKMAANRGSRRRKRDDLVQPGATGRWPRKWPGFRAFGHGCRSAWSRTSERRYGQARTPGATALTIRLGREGSRRRPRAGERLRARRSRGRRCPA